MRITKVTLKNYCQHEHRADEFGPGLIGIVGSNGSGKSNYLKGILRALTGASLNAGKKEDDVRWNADSGSVRVDFEASQTQGHVTRQLTNSRSELVFGEAKYKSSTQVDQALYDVIQISPKLLNDVVFVQQGQLEGLLFMRPAERARALQSMFGTESAEKLHQLLYEVLQGLSVESRSDAIEHTRLQLLTAQKDVESTEAGITELRKALLSDADRASAEAFVQSYDRFQLRRGARLKALDEERAATSAADASRLRVSSLRGAVQELRAATEAVRSDVDQARQRLATYQSAKLTADRRTALEAQTKSVREALSRPGPTSYQESEPKLEQCEAELPDAQNLVNVARKVSQLSGQPECPTCLQPVPVAFVEAQRASLPNLETRLKGIQERIQLLRSNRQVHQRASAQYAAEQATNTQTLRNLEAELAALPAGVVLDEKQMADDHELIQMYEKTAQDQQRSESELAVAEATAAQAEERLTRAKAGLTDYADMGEEPSQPRYEKYQAALAAHNEADRKLIGLNSQKLVEEKRVGDLRAEMDRLAAHESGLAGIKKFKNLCEKARTVLHRDQLPNLVAQAYLQSLNSRLQRYLELFEVPFLCRICPDLSVECLFDGTPRSAERLSGGQKVMLGISFRFAVNELFVNSLGLMVLDEPTVYLDKDRIGCVVKLLEKVKGYSQAAGLQLIVVTHEERLTEVFDQTIRL